MKESIRMTDKALRITLMVGSVVLALTILILSIAVGAASRQ